MSEGILPVLAAITSFMAVVLLALGLVGSSATVVEQRLATIRSAGHPDTVGTPAAGPVLPFGRRVLGQSLLGFGGWLARVLPNGLVARLQRMLAGAGHHVSPNGFLALVALSSALPLALGAAVLAAGGSAAQPAAVLVVLLLAALGAVLPLVWLRGRVRQRQRAIHRGLPDAFDLVTTSVEAGLGLDAAFARVAEKMKGPFADELGRTLREIAMGRLRREALVDLGQRTGVGDLVAFVNAVIQAEQLGVGIAQVLRVQAEQMRSRRRQQVEEAASRAPIYMLFPLVFMIFPSFMIVILGPGVIRIAETLGR